MMLFGDDSGTGSSKSRSELCLAAILRSAKDKGGLDWRPCTMLKTHRTAELHDVAMEECYAIQGGHNRAHHSQLSRCSKVVQQLQICDYKHWLFLTRLHLGSDNSQWRLHYRMPRCRSRNLWYGYHCDAVALLYMFSDSVKTSKDAKWVQLTL